jgi:chromosome segregation ATPase
VQFLETHVNLYLDTEIDKTLKVIRAEVDFLKGQLGQNERELTRIESELKSFKEQHIDGLPDQSKEQFTSRLALRTRQSELAGQVERLTLELDLARRRLQSEDPLLERKASSAETNQSALAETNRKLAEARASGFGTEHPEVQRLQKQASELERLSREAPVTDPKAAERLGGPALKEMRNRVLELEVQRTAAQKELGRVSALLGDVDRAVRSLPEVEARYAELTRSYDSTKAIRDKLFEQFKASELQVELERASAAARYEILMAPEVVDRSLRKTAAMRVAIGAFVGFLVALLIAGALELRRYLKHLA